MRQIKILHVQLTDNYGGIESLLCNIYKYIDKSQFHFDFIASGKAQYQERLLHGNSHIFYMPSIKNIFEYKRKFDNILNNRYDIVHFHKNSLANPLPIVWAKHHITRPKIIVHSHNSSPSINKRSLYLLHDINKYLIRNIPDCKVACSKEAAKWMFPNLHNVKVLPNGIDTDKFKFSDQIRKSVRKQLGISDDTLVLIHVGRFSKQKNHELLIKIFQEIVNKKPNSILLLLGDGELRKKICKKVNNNQIIKQKVLFLGLQKDVNKYLSASDIFILPSLYEGLAIVAIEAQCNGIQGWVSDAISKETFISPNIKTFSLDMNPEEIASKVLNNSNGLNQYNRAEQFKVIANTEYCINKTVDKLSKIYKELSR